MTKSELINVLADQLKHLEQADVELAVGERRITLTAGETWSLSAADAASVALPGVLRVDVKPAATAVDTHARL
ncbi:MAG: hypothetical protein WCZ02_08600, partial [Lysobacterales bacterium]